MPWPITLFQETGISPEAFFRHMHREGIALDLILETPLGAVGVFMLPVTSAQVRPGDPALLPNVLQGIRLASACGARCVALTGLIPSATNLGATVHAACPSEERLAPVTTGHATTVAAVVLNLVELLRAGGRSLPEETVMFYGVGSIGLGALRLALDVLPHPPALRLFDPFRGAPYFKELKMRLRRDHGYRGDIGVVHPEQLGRQKHYDASVIVGATNRENTLDVDRLAPGTLVVDDSSPHCLNGLAAFERLARSKDILFTEGGFVRAAQPMPRIAHVPPTVASTMPAAVPQLFFSMLRAEDITGCILSALLAAGRPDLPPTLGPISSDAALTHWRALSQLGYAAARLNYEGKYLTPADIHGFRQRSRRSVAVT
jgi:hypothetical protein